MTRVFGFLFLFKMTKVDFVLVFIDRIGPLFEHTSTLYRKHRVQKQVPDRICRYLSIGMALRQPHFHSPSSYVVGFLYQTLFIFVYKCLHLSIFVCSCLQLSKPKVKKIQHKPGLKSRHSNPRQARIQDRPLQARPSVKMSLSEHL